MKTLYLECKMGVSGERLMGALAELIDRDLFVNTMNDIGFDGVRVEAEEEKVSGYVGTRIHVYVNGKENKNFREQHDSVDMSLEEIEECIRSLHVSERVKDDAIDVYHLIADAEAHVQGKSMNEVRFHESATKDKIADIIGVCMLMEMIDPDMVYASSIATGTGSFTTNHGLIPIPTPGIAYLLNGMTWHEGNVEKELCTPTGAALLKHFVTSFEEVPPMTTEKIGYGIEKDTDEIAKCVRAFLGEIKDKSYIVELVCNIDDQSAEEIGYAIDVLYEHGALDVYTVSAHMKKNRPGVLFTCMCKESDKDTMIELMFRHLTTLGIREHIARRHTLKKEEDVYHGYMGDIRVKKSYGYGVKKEKMEFEDLKKIADETGMSISEIVNIIEKNRR